MGMMQSKWNAVGAEGVVLTRADHTLFVFPPALARIARRSKLRCTVQTFDLHDNLILFVFVRCVGMLLRLGLRSPRSTRAVSRCFDLPLYTGIGRNFCIELAWLLLSWKPLSSLPYKRVLVIPATLLMQVRLISVDEELRLKGSVDAGEATAFIEIVLTTFVLEAIGRTR